jgi:putative selenate reductase molybdopterin-binding subunit
VLNAARILRGEAGGGGEPFRRVMAGSPISPAGAPHAGDMPWTGSGAQEQRRSAETHTLTQSPISNLQFSVAPEPDTAVVGKAEKKVDAAKLAQGKPAFVDDYPMPGMLHAAMLTSPHAHARIRDIRVERARALPGVHAVLTYKDVPRVIYASGGQSYPNPPPYDQVSLDNKVRHVGDRVAVVAAETPEIARQALGLIEVDYEALPAVFDPDLAMQPGAPVIHDEPDAVKIKDASRNLVATVHARVGDVERGFEESEAVIEREYRVHQVQPASIEPHVCMSWWDEDDRLVIRTSTQVPFHVRRMLAPLIGLPVKRIRVIKPRVGGGFGGKQEMLIEDLCAHLTLATGRPVRFEYTREQEFTSARSRHPQRIVFKAGFRFEPGGAPSPLASRRPVLHALRLYVLGNTGAYGTHGLTVQTVSGLRGLSTYRCPHMEFACDIVYTNLPVPGAFRGYGAPQVEFALECLMDEAARQFDLDPVEFRRPNWVRVGDPLPLARALGEAREGFDQVVRTCALEECHQQGMAAVGWAERDRRAGLRFVPYPDRPWVRRGVGVATCMHGTAIAGLDMGAASIKMNDDGSFNVAVGATDIGTGSDTVIAQIVAETLGVPVQDIIMHSSDTDFTPFDVGAYASSTTYISGGAAKKAAEQVAQQIREVAAEMLRAAGGIVLRGRRAWAPDGRSVSLEEVALRATHQENQRQIMATASHMSLDSPPPFGAQFAEVEVDTQTGEVTVTRLVMAVDCGVAINPATASGQIEGGNVQALGYAVCEEMAYDGQGRLLNPRFGPYRIFSADEAPELQAILVQTYEPTGPYGAKAVAEIPMDGVAPAVANAVFHATGRRFYQLPLTPERVWRRLKVEG